MCTLSNIYGRYETRIQSNEAKSKDIDTYGTSVRTLIRMAQVLGKMGGCWYVCVGGCVNILVYSMKWRETATYLGLIDGC